MFQNSATDPDPFTAELVERDSAGAQAHAPLTGTSSVRKSFGANVLEGVGNLVLLVWTIVSDRFRIFDTDYQMIVLLGCACNWAVDRHLD
ncbi:MAG: hypothetical protein VXZ38_09240 [Planctomycetota bacterium]|nr:hypothetical protein [Planctomycetota bacterium]